MRRRACAVLLLVLALSFSARLAWHSRDMPQLGSIWDDGIYFASAKSLAEDSGYRILSLPGQPYQTKYPPLYPLLLSCIWRIDPQFPENLQLAVALSWCLFPLFLLSACFFYRELGLGFNSRWLLCLFLSMSPAIVLFSLNLMTELAFTSLLMGSLIFVERSARDQSRLWRAAAAGVLAGAACLTRTAGAPLLITAPVYLAIRGRKKSAALFLACMLPAVAAWNFWAHAHISPASDVVTLYYTNYLGYHLYNFSFENLPAMLWRNVSGLLTGIGGLIIVNVNGSPAVKILSWILTILSVAGCVRLTKRASKHCLAFSACFVFLLAVWHFPPDERYVMPVFPFLLAGLLTELRHVAQTANRSFSTGAGADRATAVLLSTMLAGLGFLSIYLTYRAWTGYLPGFIQRERSRLAGNRRAYRWISDNLPKGATFLCHYDTVLYFYTGRPATRMIIPPRLYYSRDRSSIINHLSSLEDFMREHGLFYILLAPGDFYSAELPGYGVPLVRDLVSKSPNFRLLYQSADRSIYRRISDGR